MIVSAQFLGMTKDGGVDIQSIVALGDDLNNVAIQTLDSYGRTDKMFMWDDWQFDTPCWADENGPAEKILQPGEALWVQGVNGYKFQSAGQVGTSDIVFNLKDGNVLVGNAFPIGVSIQDIIATGDDLNDVAIQTLDTYGRTDKMFMWDDWQFDAPCWADENGPTDMILQPGEGLWVQGKTGYTIRIPAPEL